MNFFTDEKCHNSKSACDSCMNRITMPSLLATIDVEIMVSHGWDVTNKNNKTILTKKCDGNNCPKESNRDIDEFEELTFAY